MTSRSSWAESAGVHLVFDEIYALSVFGEAPFQSVASLRPELGPRVHIVWAFSKDFERRLGEGTFALQAHDPKSVVYYKNIYIKELPE